jgi:hypothetical protein
MRRMRSPYCARAASGHAATPPSNVMNSRRFKLALMQSPRRRVAEKPRLIDPQAFFHIQNEFEPRR